MLKTPIMIPVFEYTEEENKLAELDLYSDSLGFEKTQQRAFYSIDSVFSYDDERGYAAFYSGGSSFVSPMSVRDLTHTINTHINKL